MIRLERVAVSHVGQSGTVPALRGIDLAVEAGEWLGVMGASGAGKTTLLRTIAGLETPRSGSVRVDGREVGRLAPAERGVGMVFQDHPLFPHLDVRRNLGFALRQRGVGTLERERRLGELAEALSLRGLMDRMPHELSGGERQRVALGSVLVLRPRVLLLDEPFGQLDAALRTDLRAELRVVRERWPSVTVVLVTHEFVDAMALGDRVALLEAGELRQVDKPSELFLRPAHLAVARWVGEPPMNLQAGAIVEDRGRRVFRGDAGWEWQLPAAGPPLGRVVLGIRPHEVMLQHADGEGTVGFDARVDGVEFAGSESTVRLRVGAATWMARVPWGRVQAVGMAVRAGFAWSCAHWFEERSGRRLES